MTFFRVAERPEPRKPWHDSKHCETSASLCDSSARERVVESCVETRARVNKPSLFPTCSSRMFSISTLILGVFFRGLVSLKWVRVVLLTHTSYLMSVSHSSPYYTFPYSTLPVLCSLRWFTMNVFSHSLRFRRWWSRSVHCTNWWSLVARPSHDWRDFKESSTSCCHKYVMTLNLTLCWLLRGHNAS